MSKKISDSIDVLDASYTELSNEGQKCCNKSLDEFLYAIERRILKDLGDLVGYDDTEERKDENN